AEDIDILVRVQSHAIAGGIRTEECGVGQCSPGGIELTHGNSRLAACAGWKWLNGMECWQGRTAVGSQINIACAVNIDADDPTAAAKRKAEVGPRGITQISGIAEIARRIKLGDEVREAERSWRAQRAAGLKCSRRSGEAISVGDSSQVSGFV